ncbi:MAG: glycoside hydrolase family 28 protein [Ruminococcus flavefaciens]|nr:glycoside hydrolase family 28 protein [Ruminococcus flavefaciens]
MFKKLFISSVSACFEIKNRKPYYNGRAYKVLLDGKPVGTDRGENVFSLFDLEPDTEYTVSTTCGKYSLTFKTLPETAKIDVKSLGARADGITDDTYYVQKAIDSCPAGGRVVLTEGTYLVRPIVLRSNVTLELKKGATLLGDAREESYPYVPARTYKGGKEEILASWEGEPFDCHQSFISAYKQSDIKVIGEGTINGNADNSTWWATPKGRKVARPRLVFLNKCKNVVFHGVTCKNSASWNLHPFFSKNLAFYDLRIQNPYTGPNTDGLDPESCDRVSIIGCVFSVGDDCCAIKSGKLYMGRTYKTPASNHTLRNNLFQNGHGAIVLGSEMSGGVTNLSVSQCLFRHTDRGLRIKSRRGRGKDGIIDGVVFENIKMENVITPLVVNMYYFCDPDGHTEYVWSRDKNTPVDDGTPYLGDFVFRDIECVDCECMAGYFDGLVERPIKSITLENVSFSFKEDAKSFEPAMLENVSEYCKAGLYVDNVETLTLKNVSFKGVEGEKIIKKNCNKVINQ